MPTKIEKDSVTGTQTTGHEWDGVKELNTPLPTWWAYVFYATIIWSVGYVIVYPAIPWFTGHTTGVFGYTARGDVATQMAAARAAQGEWRAKIEQASLEDIAKDPDLQAFALAGGKTAFADNCAPCHGTGGAGAKGYPNLNDDDWLWGGGLKEIYTTLQYGVRADHAQTRQSDMPRFGVEGMLNREQINDVAEFVLSLSGRSTDAAAAKRGQPLYAENCVACHGEKGEGNRELGAPKLSDQIWLYGGDKAGVAQSIHAARRGVMPAWSGRLDDVTLKQLSIYVHSLGGGQ